MFLWFCIKIFCKTHTPTTLFLFVIIIIQEVTRKGGVESGSEEPN